MFAPPAPRLVTRLVAEYFRRVASLPFAARHGAARAELYRMVTEMYREEGRTPREWRRLRGTARRQKKTALPLVVLGLAAWLASSECRAQEYARHRAWLVRTGKFIRWIDDAADLADDERADAANVVRQALARRAHDPTIGERLAVAVARRGRRVVEEWRVLSAVRDAETPPVLATVLAAWMGESEAIDRGEETSRVPVSPHDLDRVAT
jgi:hypothetical protein